MRWAFIGQPAHVLLDEPLEAMDRGAETILAWSDRRGYRRLTFMMLDQNVVGGEPLLELSAS